MEPYEFIGITFRSAEHAMWFKFTTSVMLLSVIFAVYRFRKKAYNAPAVLWFWLACSEFGFSTNAVHRTNFGEIDGPIWSSDCIWYNGLLAIVYLALALLASGLKARGAKTPRFQE